jgi:predicted O-linked N-acetylglucosamine transferase (SPINDLY family)
MSEGKNIRVDRGCFRKLLKRTRELVRVQLITEWCKFHDSDFQIFVFSTNSNWRDQTKERYTVGSCIAHA